MPATIVLSAIYGSTFMAAAALGAVGYAVATFAINLVASYVVSRLFLTRANSNSISSDGSRIQLPPATNNKLPVFYGTAWLRPTITDAKISMDQKTMWYVLALSEVPIAKGLGGFGDGTITYTNRIRWGDKSLVFDGTDQTRVVSWNPTGYPGDPGYDSGQTDTRISGKLFIYKYSDGSNTPATGTPSSAITVLQDSAISPNERWTSTDLMYKCAFIVVKVVYDQEIGLTGLDQVTVQMNNSLKDPGGCIYDYLVDTRYGCAVTSVDTQALQNLSAYSAQTITYTPQIYAPQIVVGQTYTIQTIGTTDFSEIGAPNNIPGTVFTATDVGTGTGTVTGGSATQARYEINGPLDTGQDCMTNLQTLMDACDSWLQWNESLAQWSVVINKAYDQSAGTIPAQTISDLFNITDDNVIGSINLNPVDLNSTYNRIEVSYPDSSIFDQVSTLFVDLDSQDKNPNEPDNLLNMQLPVTNNSVTARYIATRRLIQSREDLIVTLSMDFSGIQIDAGDLVRINSDKFQWVNKVFRVTQVQEGKDESGFLYAMLTMIEYNPQVYGNISINQYIPAPNTGITDPNLAATPAAPTISNVVSVSDVPKFDLNMTIPSSGRYAQVQFWVSSATTAIADFTLLKTLSPAGTNTFPTGAVISYTVTGLPAGTYYFRTRVITVTGSQSGYSSATAALVWTPTVVVPSSLGTSLEFNPSAIFCPSNSDGTSTTTGQTGALSLKVGPVTVAVWDKITPATQPNNSWYANTITGSSGLTLSALTLDTANDVVSFTVTGMTSAIDQGTATISNIFYKDGTGTVNNLGSAELLVTKVKSGAPGVGTPGTKYNTAYLYQWTSATPGDPNGSSTFDWTTGTNGGYTGGNGWTTAIGSNPGGPGVKLWIAEKPVSAPGGDTTTPVSWSSGFVKYFASENGAGGAQYVVAEVFTWATSTPTISGPDGTYTWATGGITGIPSPWNTNPGTPPSIGYTLWSARIPLTAASGTSTSPIVWASASIIATGYSGSAGGSARTCYARIPGNPSPGSATITVTGDNPPSQAQSAAAPPIGWNLNYAWSITDPNPASTDSLFQSNGVYDSNTGNTVWDTPFLSSLRVGQLSSITSNTGNLTVSGQIQAGTAAISGTTMTGTGSIVYASGEFAMGNPTTNITFNGTAVTLNGPLATVASGAATSGSVESFASSPQWTGTPTNVVSITTTGAPVKIIGSAAIQYEIIDNSPTDYAASAIFQVRLKMDGNYLSGGIFVCQYPTFVSQSGTNRHAVLPNVPVVFRHTPTAGAHTYQIELYAVHYGVTGAAYTNSGTMYGQFYFIAEENKI